MTTMQSGIKVDVPISAHVHVCQKKLLTKQESDGVSFLKQEWKCTMRQHAKIAWDVNVSTCFVRCPYKPHNKASNVWGRVYESDVFVLRWYIGHVTLKLIVFINKNYYSLDQRIPTTFDFNFEHKITGNHRHWAHQEQRCNHSNDHLIHKRSSVLAMADAIPAIPHREVNSAQDGEAEEG